MSTLLDEAYLDESYYTNAMSLFLKRSTKTVEQILQYYNILLNVNECALAIFGKLNLSEESDGYWLDIIGDIFGIKRQIVVDKYVTKKDNGWTTVTEQKILDLNDNVFRLYIMSTAAKYNFDGTAESLLKIYRGSDICGSLNEYATWDDETNEIITDFFDSQHTNNLLQQLDIKYKSDSTKPAHCGLYISSALDNDIDMIYTLFVNGLLTVESAGIAYEYIAGTSQQDALWDTARFYSFGNVPYDVFG